VLTSLSVHNFRCIEDAELELDPEGTGIVGPNGAGKTSLLEAIYFLAHGRSFRTSQRGRLIGLLPSPLRVVGTIEHDRTVVAGVEYQAGATRARLGGATLRSISAIAEVLPVQVIDPGVHRLIEEGSARRRRLLDWGVFHVEHGFMEPWRRYQRALAQRNAALRTSHAEARLWVPELSACALEIDRMRRGYAAILNPQFRRLAADLSGRDCDVRYHRGWDDALTLADALEKSWSRDVRVKTTTVGPHRADLIVSADGEPARDRISRGQQKLIAAGLVLAQLSLAAPTTRYRACLLLDDPAAELDVDSLGKILSAIQRVPAQLVVTSLSEAGLRGIKIGKTFHVKQGRFTRMV
jgi:DNA replication and repair protein RecF